VNAVNRLAAPRGEIHKAKDEAFLSMKYISLFTGVGGLESAGIHPLLCCEIDAACWPVLRRRFGDVQIHPDIRTLQPPPADVIVGGWPCQDISVAGLQKGLSGERSGLFFEMLGVAVDAGAHTIIAENVPNLLGMEGGEAFQLVLEALSKEGFTFVAWRTINAREFGLPHNRERIFIVASKHREAALALHRPYQHELVQAATEAVACKGFYWTAGLQSIC
jgi:DNA (cytosine-5)-methyltransferase 1